MPVGPPGASQHGAPLHSAQIIGKIECSSAVFGESNFLPNRSPIAQASILDVAIEIPAEQYRGADSGTHFPARIETVICHYRNCEVRHIHACTVVAGEITFDFLIAFYDLSVVIFHVGPSLHAFFL